MKTAPEDPQAELHRWPAEGAPHIGTEPTCSQGKGGGSSPAPAPLASGQGGLSSRCASLTWNDGRGWQVGAWGGPSGEIQGGEAPAEEPGWDAVSREMGEEPLRAPPNILSSTEGKSEGRQSPGRLSNKHKQEGCSSPDGASRGTDTWGEESRVGGGVTSLPGPDWPSRLSQSPFPPATHPARALGDSPGLEPARGARPGL